VIFFLVLNPYRLVISFIAFIRIECYLNICSRLLTSNHADGSFWGCLDKCNRDYFQCNHNRLHCDFVYS